MKDTGNTHRNKKFPLVPICSTAFRDHPFNQEGSSKSSESVGRSDSLVYKAGSRCKFASEREKYSSWILLNNYLETQYKCTNFLTSRGQFSSVSIYLPIPVVETDCIHVFINLCFAATNILYSDL